MKSFAIKTNQQLYKTKRTTTKANQVPQLKLPTRLNLNKGLSSQIPISQIQPTTQFSRHSILQKSKQQVAMTDQQMQEVIQKKLNTNKTTSTRYEEEEICIKSLTQSEVNIGNFDAYVTQITTTEGKNAVNGKIDNLCRRKLQNFVNTKDDIDKIMNKFRDIYYELITLETLNPNTSSEDVKMYKCLFEFIAMISSNITKNSNIDEQLIYPFIISKLTNMTSELAQKIQMLMQAKIKKAEEEIKKAEKIKERKIEQYIKTSNTEIEKTIKEDNSFNEIKEEISNFLENKNKDRKYFNQEYVKQYMIYHMISNIKNTNNKVSSYYDEVYAKAIKRFLTSDELSQINNIELQIREKNAKEHQLQTLNHNIMQKIIQINHKFVIKDINKSQDKDQFIQTNQEDTITLKNPKNHEKEQNKKINDCKRESGLTRQILPYNNFFRRTTEKKNPTNEEQIK